ncbi:hypothetical protein [Streptomyces sp. UH6]|uniref:hypothetical protein n=1 Tax=Streptomyces sp. UH6 TaxID=2748379 RepID=UPI0015D48581|nr:hypothetical protein [Streptomyces sp. UH6]NYV72894.1 hypothetical protein [Streptomyces sp. UH6]
MNSVLLHLYPQRFRRAFGYEMAEAYREATAGAGRRARFGEAADVVAHALRMRLGLTSTRPGGRLLAVAAPFALAVTAAYAAFNLHESTSNWYVMGAGGGGMPLVTPLNGCYLLTLIGAVIALAGPYLAGALCSVAGTLGSSVVFLHPAWPTASDLRWDFAAFLITPVLAAALPLLCPPDLRPAPRARNRAGVLAVAVWAVLLVGVLTVTDPVGTGLLLPWRFGVPLAAALFLAGRQAFTRIRTTAHLALATAPLITVLHFSGWTQSTDTLAALGALAVAAGVLRLRRRSGSHAVDPA